MKPFDLTTIYHKDRPLSWSAIASFEWNPAQWHAKYVAKELPEITPELEFGSMIDKRIQEDKKYLPKLVRYDILQHEMRGTFGGIPLLGYADTFRSKLHSHGRRHAVRDYKTGRKPWDQKRSDETGQLTMYAFLLYMQHKIKPEELELFIDWLPTHYVDGKIAFIKEGDIHTFKTKRSMRQVLAFGQRIKDSWSAMELYAAAQAGLSTSDMSDWLDKGVAR